MTEPDVVITDYLLSVESILFAWLLVRTPSTASRIRGPFGGFFAATGVGSLAGGTVHGFFLTNESLAGVVLWRAALLAIGAAALCGWIIGARLLFGSTTARTIGVAASVESIVYAVVIAGVNDRFWVAVANYLPPTLFLMVGLGVAYRTTRARALALGVAGLASTLAAAVIQQLRVAAHPVYFNHNALYHAIQAAALFMIFRAARWLVHTREAAL